MGGGARQDRPVGESVSFPGEFGKDRLRHVLSQVCIAVDLPERCRINEREMPLDQFGERAFGIGLRVAAEQFAIGYHLQPIVPGQTKTAQKRFRWRTGRETPKAGAKGLCVEAAVVKIEFDGT